MREVTEPPIDLFGVNAPGQDYYQKWNGRGEGEVPFPGISVSDAEIVGTSAVGEASDNEYYQIVNWYVCGIIHHGPYP